MGFEHQSPTGGNGGGMDDAGEGSTFPVGGRSQAHVEDITEIWFLWHIYSAMVHA